ncbi:hypothetical protein D3C73_881780 [compost metagenome]
MAVTKHCLAALRTGHQCPLRFQRAQRQPVVFRLTAQHGILHLQGVGEIIARFHHRRRIIIRLCCAKFNRIGRGWTYIDSKLNLTASERIQLADRLAVNFNQICALLQPVQGQHGLMLRSKCQVTQVKRGVVLLL